MQPLSRLHDTTKKLCCCVKTSAQRGSARGVRPRSQWDYSHQKCPSGLFDERSEIFRGA